MFKFKFRKKTWPNGTLPFSVNPSGFTPTALQNIINAIDYWNTTSNWQLIERIDEDDFIEFIVGKENANPKGFQGGRQNLKLSNNCSYETAVQAIAVAIGV